MPLAILFACCMGLFFSPASAESDGAWAALRKHGVVLFRHAHAPGTGDPPGMKIGDCSTQRNLDETGREQARRIGIRMTEKNITIGRVLSSQWCRTVETATLAFGSAVEPEAAFNSFFDDSSKSQAQTHHAQKIIAAWKGPGALVIVTHHVNIHALTGIHAASSEGIVLKLSGGKVSVAGRISP